MFSSTFVSLLLRPGRTAWYCDELSLSVCLSACMPARLLFSKINVKVISFLYIKLKECVDYEPFSSHAILERGDI